GLDVPPVHGKVCIDAGKDYLLGRISAEAPGPERLLGWTSLLSNQRRSVALVAGPDGCEVLAIKRQILLDKFSACPALKPWRRKHFWETKLPRLLSDNQAVGPQRPSPE